MKRLLFFFCAFCACKPDVDMRTSIVGSPRVLAIRADPAEASPGAAMRYTLLLGASEGTSDGPVEWAYCTSPKPLTENDVIGADCLDGAAQRISADAKLPPNACQLFGPDPPPGGFRPRDPDDTGGYYQPVRALTRGEPTIAFTRVACNLGDAPTDIAADFGRRYHANANPALHVDVPASVAPGARTVFRASWEAEDAEAYVYFDREAQIVRDRREAMRVSWFATAGAFDVDRTGRAEDDAATDTEDAWTAPTAPATVHVWVVLRDSRGGVAWAVRDVKVK
jgi:hypothetical protein